ncbi:MAG: phosphoribosylamine--glycine ligase [Deltaproteobacteria bacterium]|nr:phosphoribosylamine--glycine ligase [Deltaproteobacteria bacterium]
MPKVLVVGSGGREHALVDGLLRSPSHPEVLCAPGNAGIGAQVEVVGVQATDVPGLVRLAQDRGVDLVVVGPEAPLVVGLADALRAVGIPVLGPSQAAAQLEGSKTFAKEIMEAAQVPTARWGTFTEAEPAITFAQSLGGRAVIKADGLAAGKGVVVADHQAEATQAIRDLLGGAHGSAGHRLVVEERLEGPELSVIGLSDGERVVLLPAAQDHKRIFDGDQGPNTGGMGAYAPAPAATPGLLAEIEARCLRPVLAELARRGAPFCGFLYAGLMLTAEGPKVLEYNARLGDPETEVIVPLLDEDLYRLFLDAAQGQLVERALSIRPGGAVTVVLAAAGYPAAPQKGDVVRGLTLASALEGVRVYHAGTTRQDGAIVTAGGRVLAVTGLGPTLLAAAEVAYRGVALLEFPGRQYRRDIGARALGRAVGAG